MSYKRRPGCGLTVTKSSCAPCHRSTGAYALISWPLDHLPTIGLLNESSQLLRVPCEIPISETGQLQKVIQGLHFIYDFEWWRGLYRLTKLFPLEISWSRKVNYRLYEPVHYGNSGGLAMRWNVIHTAIICEDNFYILILSTHETYGTGDLFTQQCSPTLRSQPTTNNQICVDPPPSP